LIRKLFNRKLLPNNDLCSNLQRILVPNNFLFFAHANYVPQFVSLETQSMKQFLCKLSNHN